MMQTVLVTKSAGYCYFQAFYVTCLCKGTKRSDNSLVQCRMSIKCHFSSFTQLFLQKLIRATNKETITVQNVTYA